MNILYKFPKRKLWIAYLFLSILIGSSLIFMISGFFAPNTASKNQNTQTEITIPGNDTNIFDDPPVIPPVEEMTSQEKTFYSLFDKIKTLEEISKDYNEENYQKRVITYLRSIAYNNFAWNTLLGSVDSNFVTAIQNYDTQNGTSIASLTETPSLTFVIPTTGDTVDFCHMFAVMEGFLTANIALADFTGWGGDLLQLAGSVVNGTITSSQISSKFNASSGSTFGSADVCADLDAVNIISIYNASTSKSLYNSIINYYQNLKNTNLRIEQFNKNNFIETYSSKTELKNIIINRLSTTAEGVGSMVFNFVFGYNFSSNKDTVEKCVDVFVDYIY